MASESSNAVTTVYQCSECEHCSQNLEEATLHAVQEHGEDRDEDEVNLDDSEEESFPKIHIKEDKDNLSSEEEYSSSSVYKQTNGNFDIKIEKNNKSEKWTASSTRALLEQIHEHYHELQNKTAKKKAIWEQIKKSLDNQVPGLTPFKCEQKWKALFTSYKKYVSGYNKSYTQSKFKKPEFFDEVAEVVGDDLSNLSRETSPFTTKGKGAPTAKDSLSYSLQALLNDEDTLNSHTSARGSETLSVLNRLVGLLERREAANEKFQREVLEMEREKLQCMQQFIEGREKFNTKRLHLMKEWMINQPKAKRKRDDD